MDNLAVALRIAPRPILNSFFLSTAATLLGMVFGLAVSYPGGGQGRGGYPGSGHDAAPVIAGRCWASPWPAA
jgi:hypothetical protein